MIKRIGQIEDKYKESLVNQLLDEYEKTFIYFDAEAYIGYPIYIDEYSNKNITIDLALISKGGIYIINVLNEPVTNYTDIQDNIYIKIESKFKKQKNLLNRHNLSFDFDVITVCEKKMEAKDGYPLVSSLETFIAHIKTNIGNMTFDETKYRNIISALQEAYGINSYIERTDIKANTKAFCIMEMSKRIDKYDNYQMEAILADTEGIQRIRGMAGSGKTVILARKAVELHTAHPDWNIAVTFSTRSLKNQLERLIGKFYSMKNEGAKYNEKKLKIMHSWGSANSEGLYYDICTLHGISPLNYTQAKNRYFRQENVFKCICEDLVKNLAEPHKLYDCILIDEAQDFDKSFLQLCLKVLGKEQRLVYAYDELQKLNEETMPSPESIFGKAIKQDTPISVCYRNQSKVIVTAHAIGMGLYSKEGLIQIPNINVWETIGYKTDSEIKEGQKVILYRTSETSPDLLNDSRNEIIDFENFDNTESMKDALLYKIKLDLEKEQLLPRDIMIIDMDSFEYNTNWQDLNWELRNNPDFNNIRIHVSGASNPEDFYRDDSIVYSSIRRAKGNESYMVYIINAQNCITSLNKITNRNALFTAITRSKGWVRVLGTGKKMQQLCEEFIKVKENNFQLIFDKYPDKEEQKKLLINNKDLSKGDNKILTNAKYLFDRLKKESNISNLELLQEFTGLSKNDLLELINNSEE